MSAASYVLFPLGKKRFAMRAESVTELARPDRLHEFPHTSPLLTGVLFRRGRIVPVCDIGPVLLGADAPPRKFYVMICRQVESVPEWTAIPVTGECELVNGEEQAPTGKSPAWVTGLLAVPNRPEGMRSAGRAAAGEDVIEVLDIERLIAAGMSGVTA
jgi:chemotaxis signal transduction protein